jgi:hypothetical protein
MHQRLQSTFIILVCCILDGRMIDKIRYLKCSFDLNHVVIKLFDKNLMLYIFVHPSAHVRMKYDH